MIEWTTERRKVSELKDYAKNPRRFTAKGMADLKASMERLGYIDAIAINQDGTIIGGHARKKMLKQLKVKEVDVRVPDRLLTDKEIDEAIIRLNKNVAGEWDFDALANNFEIDDLVSWGFAAEELGITQATEGLTDPDEVPDAPDDPISVLGDVWVLGNHRLMCGDSTSIEAVEKLMAGQKADMVFTDPPYNINYQGVKDKRAKIKNDNMSEPAFLDFLSQSLLGCETMYVCCSWQYAHLFKRAMEGIARKPKAMIVWNKVNPAQNLDKYFKQHEIIFYYGDFGGQKTIRGDVWEVKRQPNPLHPTMKPVELIQMALNDQPEKKIVYDGFGGSGSTLIACEMSGRHGRLMELDPKYCDVIIQRYMNFTGKEAIHERTEKFFNQMKQVKAA